MPLVYRVTGRGANDCPQVKSLSTDFVRRPTTSRPDATVVAMCTSPGPAQPLRFLQSATRDHDVPAPLARRLLELSDAARAFDADRAWLDSARRHRLLAELRDDTLCEHARLMAPDEGEQLWRELLSRARPPDDAGPALLLAISLDARCAADEARDVLDAVLRPGEYRRWALELAIDLAEDGGRPDRAWELLGRLGADRRMARYGTLHCVVFCTAELGCPAARRPATVRARWLWQRARKWAAYPWSELHLGGDEQELLRAEGGPLAELLQEHGSLQGTGPMSRGLFGYLRRRWRLLPEDERKLVLRWLRVQWRRYLVVETRDYELVVSDAYGQTHTAGTEEIKADRTWLPGDMISGWLLPTSAPDERLLVLNTAPAAWARRAGPAPGESVGPRL